MSVNSHTGTVAWLLNGNEGYGVASVMLALSGKLQQRGWRTPLICMADGDLARQCRESGYEVVNLNVGSGPSIRGNPFRRLQGMLESSRFERKAIPALVDALREVKPDVIEMQKSNLLGVGGPAAQQTGVIPIWDTGRCLSTSVPLGLNWRYYQRICHRWGITIIATCKHLASTLGDHPIKPIVVYNGVDAERFDPARVNFLSKRQVNIPDNSIVFGIVARLTPLKGQDRFLKAMLSIGKHEPPLHLLVIGGPIHGEYARGLKEIARAAGAEDRLHMPGLVLEPEKYYRAIDVAVNSRVDAEGFGLSVVEAMLLERPVLAHTLGGPIETVADNITGWHVPEPTVAAFAAGIRRALADRRRWPEMGQAARRRALEHYTTDRQADRFLNVVRSLMEKRKRAEPAAA